MGTALATGTRSSAPPSIKLQNVGDSVKFAVVDVTLDLPMTEYGTEGTPKLNRNGKQMTQHALTVLVLEPGQGVTTGDAGKTYEPCEAHELHTIYISSYAKWDPDRDEQTAPFKSWGGATDDAGKSFGVGYIGVWKFLEEIPGQGAQPRKDRKFRFRAPKAEEQSIVARCEELHAEQRSLAATGTPLSAHAAANHDDDIESF
jgi:hypothetical protein